jgi:hypothetical protein
LWPVAIYKKRGPISDVDSDLSQVKTLTTTIFDLQTYLVLSYISEREGIYCDNMPHVDALRHEVLWSYEVTIGIFFPCRHVNLVALKVKDFRGEINISRLVQEDCDDVKGLRPEYWVIIYHSDSDWHVIEGTAEVVESDL